MSIVVVDTNVW